MPEQQNIEYKSNWHDDYLKWVCGFANAQGGVIFIGKDDYGKVVGIKDYKKLMDDIPNKVRNALGITVEVNLHEDNDKHFIEIITHPYSVPISLRGCYYFRSGSTKQELTGASLNEFLLNKSGKTWDDVIEPRASFADIDEKTFSAFLKMSEEKGRMPETIGLTLPQIFEKLLLSENGQLKRGAVILFGKHPTKFYPNTFLKLGRFKDNDILFHDVEEGNLITLLRNVVNQLNHKYLTHKIHFEGLYRVEKGKYPSLAIREMLLNALVHRNYMGAPTQLRVYDDKINIWNDGALPPGIGVEKLKEPDPSIPRNPIIAGVCFKGGLIDSWGSGIIRIIETCKEAELPEPELEEEFGGFKVTLFGKMSESRRKDVGKSSESRRKEIGKGILETLSIIEKNPEYTVDQIAEIIGKSTRTIERHIAKLKEEDILIRKGGTFAGYWEIDKKIN